MFASEYYNYKRWISIHLLDLMSSPSNCLAFFHQFFIGNFSFQESERDFSMMGLTRLHDLYII